MTDFNHHYKEITPLDTIKNVQEFFNSHGITLVERDINESEAGTWYCHIDAYLGDNHIGGANGKGITNEYSRASGYAELYERFCNFYCRPNHYVNNEVKIQNKALGNNYKLRHDEKQLTYDELINIPIVNKYINRMAPNNPILQKACIDYWTDNDYIGYPFVDIENPNNICYLDPRVAIRITHSIGMVAGNTVSEALNQGLSELCERENELWLYFERCKYYHSIDLNSIKSPVLQEKIHNLQALGYDFYIFDYSYESGLPGVMSLLIDRKHGILNVNFGSFPVFEIAVERVITELYQGIKSYHADWYKERLQRPFKGFTSAEIAQIYANSIAGDVFPAHFFDQIVEEPHCSDVYADPNSTNEELNQYFCDLAKKKGYKFYYCNTSLSDKLTALHLFLDAPDTMLYWDDVWNSSPAIQKKDLELIGIVHRLCKQIIEKDDNTTDFMALIRGSMHPNFDGEFLGLNMLWNNFCISSGSGNEFYHFSNLINNIGINQIPTELTDTPVYLPMKKLAMLQNYMRTGLYNKEELKRIFNELYNFNITDEDLKNCGNADYMLKEIYFKPMIEYVNSSEFKEFCSIFVNK